MTLVVLSHLTLLAMALQKLNTTAMVGKHRIYPTSVANDIHSPHSERDTFLKIYCDNVCRPIVNIDPSFGANL